MEREAELQRSTATSVEALSESGHPFCVYIHNARFDVVVSSLFALATPILKAKNFVVGTIAQTRDQTVGALVADTDPVVGQRGLRCGSVELFVRHYRGGHAFEVREEKKPESVVAVVNPGDRFFVMHAVGNRKYLERLDLYARVRDMMADAIYLLEMLENPNQEVYQLNERQRNIVRQLQSAPIYGISHLVGSI